MARSDLVKLAERELKPYGIGKRDISTMSIGMEAYELIWTHNGQCHRIHLPRDADNPREKAIFRSNLEKQLREFGVKLLDPSANRVDVEEQLEGIRGELTANRERCSSIEEMFLEWAGEQEKKINTFAQDLMARLGNQDTLIAAALQKKPVEIAPVVQAPQTVIPQPVPKIPKPSIEPEPKKGLEALGVVQKQQWAEIIERMNADFDLDELDLRILFFLHETGRPQSAHTLREAGVWKAVSSVTMHLEDMEEAGWVIPVAKEWGITRRGISKLQEAYSESESEEAVETIEDRLNEALANARGEPNHAKFARGPVAPDGPGTVRADDVVKPKPALTVVPSGPRVLKPVTPIASLNLSYIEKAMVTLLDGEKTIEELQKAIGHKSSVKSLINMLYKCEQPKEKDWYLYGCIQYFFRQGKVYRITDKGRAYIKKIMPNYESIAS